MQKPHSYTEWLEQVYSSKKDFTPDDFKVLVQDSLLPVEPEVVAEMFACLNSEEQARFFNHIEKIASSWHGGSGALCFQLQAITDEDGLTLAGRRVMQEIGDYSHWGIVPQCNREFLDT